MMHETIITHLKEMRLYGLAEALQEQVTNQQYDDLPFCQRLSFLVDRERNRRKNLQLERRLTTARIQRSATISGFDINIPRGITKERLLTYAECGWISYQQNMIVSGPTGVGKSYLASALGDKACRQGYQVRMVKSAQFATELVAARLQGEAEKTVRGYRKFQLFIFDEWLRDPLTLEQSRELLDFIDIRYGNASHIFVGQLPSELWHERFSDPTIADALLDRVVHNSHVVQLTGESMRKRLHAVGNR